MAINAINNLQQVVDKRDAGCGSRFLTACTRVGKVAKSAMQLPVRQVVGGFFTKTRQFSKGLIAKALGNTARSLATDTAGFVAGGKAAGALMTQAGPLVPYAAPVAVAAVAGTAACKLKSPKARIMAGVICLTALGTTIYLCFSSSEKRNEVSSHLQDLGLFLGVKAGHILGSFVAQRFVLGTKVNRYETSAPDFYGNTSQQLAGSYPIRLLDFEQPHHSYALRMGQYFFAREVLPVCVSGESALRDKLIPVLAYNAVPIRDLYVAFQKGRKGGLQGKLLRYAQNFVGDPKQYAEKLASSLTNRSPSANSSPLVKVFGLLASQVNNKALSPALRKMIQIVASDLPRFVEGAMRTLPQVAKFLADPRVVEARNALRNTYQVSAQDEPNAEGIRAAKNQLNQVFGEIMRERYDSLQLFDIPVSKMVEGLANYLADLLIGGDDKMFAGFSNLGEVYLGFPLEDLFGTEAAGANVENFRRDYLATFLKFYLMAVVVNYPTIKRGRLDGTEELFFLDGISTVFAEVKPLPLHDRVQEVLGDAVGKVAKVSNVLRSQAAAVPAAPAKPKSRITRFFSGLASLASFVCKAAFRVLCKGVGAFRACFFLPSRG